MYSADLWLESGAFANTASAKKKNVAILKHLGAKLTDVQRAVTRAAMKEEKAVAAGKLDKVSAPSWLELVCNHGTCTITCRLSSRHSMRALNELNQSQKQCRGRLTRQTVTGTCP